MSRTQGNIILVDNFMKIEYTIGVRKVRNALLLKGGLYMELAKVTSKGQVTIPIEIRKKLGIKNGDKILFVEEAGKIYMLNSSMDALREAQRAFAGEAERLGLHDDNDVMEMIKEIREESVVK
ncbi:AbrB/MazE/SpoVT family DNA-binding domain-containing protein [Suilimivivens aceti]|jgi:toxin-antitoxin system, antitoxin component, abrB famil|nr:AbrB/MazE/SpoVT family DNA-binding domain-containing protein [Suilimivivens aceti]